MSNYYSNPTEAKAIGAVDRELQMMRARARRIKALKENGRLTAEELALARKQFIGIYRRLLMEALSEKPNSFPPMRKAEFLMP